MKTLGQVSFSEDEVEFLLALLNEWRRAPVSLTQDEIHFIQHCIDKWLIDASDMTMWPDTHVFQKMRNALSALIDPI